jgi:NAD(P)-dependent dehydrogenase (short-subunit alcohol dehydrogenase family)
MTDFQINDADLAGFKGKVAVITGTNWAHWFYSYSRLNFTGGSSGIGLATVDLLQSLGAVVVSGDIQDPPVKSDLLFVKTDVRSWTDLASLFKAAKDKHGRVDYVFANAGIGPRADYLNLGVDENGDVQEPNKDTLDINFSSVVNTVTLGAHYLKSNAEGGSIVIMGSSTGLHPVRAVDYCKIMRRPHASINHWLVTSASAKAGIIGFGRSFSKLVEVAGLPIHVNTLAPSWTATQVLPDLKDLLAAVSQNCQSTEVVARAVAYLMATKSRNGDLIFVCDGKYTEIEKSILAPAYESIKGTSLSDDAVLAKVMALAG